MRSAISATTVPASPEAIERAARLLRAGELVGFPTETVYGLGADAMSERSVAAIFSAKGRPRFNPLIVHVPGLAAAEALAEFDARARRIAAQFWPGPLTLVLRRRSDSGLSLLASAGLDTVAIRAPAHPVACIQRPNTVSAGSELCRLTSLTSTAGATQQARISSRSRHWESSLTSSKR